MSESVDEVMSLIFGRWRSQTLYHGVELGIFEVLANGPETAAGVAEELDLDPGNTYRLLRALASLGLLDESPDRSFSLTGRGELLTKDHDPSLRGIARLIESPEQYAVWPRLSELVRTGEEEAFEDEFGQSMFEYIRTHPEHAEVFHEGMESNSAIETRDVLSALEDHDFSAFSRLCDVGGGTGHLLSHLLDEHPHLEGVVLELPEVVEQAGAVPEQLGVGDRITFTAGDMFDEVPTADAYLMKQITPDWSDEKCVEILDTIRAAAPPEAPVLVADQVVPGPDQPHFAKVFDLHMLLMTGGRLRTVEEFRDLFRRSGLEFVAHHTAEDAAMSVVEGRVA